MNNSVRSLVITSLIVIVFSIAITPVFAVSYQAPANVSIAADKTTALTEGEIMIKKPEYPLPFPGILPDHPLYFIKRFRDQLMERLIVDSVSKARFYILMGDKHVQMAVLLEEKGNTALAGTMATKAEIYLGKAYEILFSLKAGDKELPGYMTEQLINATMKHIEVLIGLSEKTKDTVITSALGAAKNALVQAQSLK